MEGTEYCSNCKRNIAKANFVMHEIHCRRNIVLCEKCKEPVPRSEVPEHNKEYHTLVKCPLCSSEVENSVLDEHQEEKCDKRPTHCQYCELELPICDIAEHRSYCGTRTEQCPSCGTFVMKKDQESHVGEQCLAIQASAAASTRDNRSSSGGASGNDINNDDNYSSFAMDELSRMLNMARTRDVPSSFGGTSGNDHSNVLSLPRPIESTGSIPPDSFYGSGASQRTTIRPKRTSVPNRSHTNGTSAELNNSSVVSTSTHRRIAPKTTINSIHRNKKTNELGRGVPSSRTTRNNPQRSHSDSVSDHRGEDLDRLLAMHLAEDLNGTGELNEYSDTDSRSFSERLNINSADYIRDDIFNGDLELPCEFCGNQLPVQILYEHQSECDLNPLSTNVNDNVLSQETEVVPNLDLHNNRRASGYNSKSSPAVVDNLGYLAASDQLNREPTIGEFNVGSEDIMLPCEFCDNLFPDDVIIQHQAVCDANLTQTPRQMSPLVTRETRRRNIRQRSPGSHDAITAGGTRRRHQEPPLPFELNRHTLKTNAEAGIFSQSERRIALKKRSNIPSNPSQISTQSNIDRNVRRKSRDSHFARALAEDSNHCDNYEFESGGSRAEQRQRNSATRTRKTLDRLMQDDIAHTNVASNTAVMNSRLSKEQKSKMNQTRQKDESAVSSGSRAKNTVTNRASSYEPSMSTASTFSGRRNKSSIPRVEPGTDLHVSGMSQRVTRVRSNGLTSTRPKTRSSSQNKDK